MAAKVNHCQFQLSVKESPIFYTAALNTLFLVNESNIPRMLEILSGGCNGWFFWQLIFGVLVGVGDGYTVDFAF